MLNIEIVGSKVKYYVTLNNRYTVLRGDSGIGKSDFVRLLVTRRRQPGYRIRFSDDEYLTVYNDDTLTLALMNDNYVNNKYLVICDDEDVEFDSRVLKMIQECVNAYFIIITRNVLYNCFKYGVKDVYTFATVNGVHVLYPMLLCEFNNDCSDSTVICMDSLYNRVQDKFRNNKVSHTPLCRDDLMKFIQALPHRERLLLVFDWSELGDYTTELNTLCKYMKVIVADG